MTDKPLSNPWWVVLGSVLGLMVGNGPVMQFTFGVFVKPVGAELHADRGTISAALMVGLLATGLTTLVVGRLVDRFGTRAVSLPAITLFGLGMAAIGTFSDSVFLLCLFYGLSGIAAAGQTPLPYARAITAVFDQRRGLALGIAMAGVGVGTALMPLLAQQLLARYGWRWAYAGLGLVTLAVALPAVAGLVTRGEALARRTKTVAVRVANGLTAAEALRSRLFWVLAAAFFAVALAASGIVAHIVPLLTDRGVAPAAASAAISAAGLALIAGRLLAGWLLDRIHGPWVAFGFFLLPLVGALLLLFTVDASLAVPAAILVGLGLGAEVDLIAFLQSRYLGLRAFGEIYGYLFAIFMAGSAFGPFLLGSVFQRTHSYGAGLWIVSGGLVVACLLMTRLGAYRFASPAGAGSAGAEPGLATARTQRA